MWHLTFEKDLLILMYLRKFMNWVIYFYISIRSLFKAIVLEKLSSVYLLWIFLLSVSLTADTKHFNSGHQMCRDFSLTPNGSLWHHLDFLQFNSILTLYTWRVSDPIDIRTRSHKTAPTHFRCHLQVVGPQVPCNFFLIWWQIGAPPPPQFWLICSRNSRKHLCLPLY